MEAGDPDGLDIISQAFHWDCDLVLQKVFLYLDPYSLKSCRQVTLRQRLNCDHSAVLTPQVCREWNDFIRKRLWRSPYGLRRLRDRLRGQYFTEQPQESELEVARGGVESQVRGDISHNPS